MNAGDFTDGLMSSGQSAPSDHELWLRVGGQHFETAYAAEDSVYESLIDGDQVR
jgi:hypothetical protein